MRIEHLLGTAERSSPASAYLQRDCSGGETVPEELVAAQAILQVGHLVEVRGTIFTQRFDRVHGVKLQHLPLQRLVQYRDLTRDEPHRATLGGAGSREGSGRRPCVSGNGLLRGPVVSILETKTVTFMLILTPASSKDPIQRYSTDKLMPCLAIAHRQLLPVDGVDFRVAREQPGRPHTVDLEQHTAHARRSMDLSLDSTLTT